MTAFAAALGALGMALLVRGGAGLVPSSRGVAVAAAVVLTGALLGWREHRRGRRFGTGDGFAAAAVALAALFVVPASRRPEAFLPGPELAPLAPYFLAAGALLAGWLSGARGRRSVGLLLVLQAALVAASFDYTQGALPTRDDHPSFLYRFHVLAESFPRLVVYNPEWNAGYLTTEIVASGVLGPFAAFAPVLALAPLERAYGWIVPYLVLGVLPGMIFVAARRAGTGRAGAAFAAALTLAPTTALFRHALVFGVLPFVLASGAAVLATALFARSFLEGRGGPWITLALVVTTSLCLVWPFGVLMLLPVIPAFVLAWPRVEAAARRRAVVVALALVAVNAAWLHPLVAYGKAFGVLAAQRSALAAGGFSWGEAGKAGIEVFDELHPALLVLGPLGLGWLVTARRATGALFAAAAVWSLVVVVIGPQVKEHVALDRFALPFALFLAVGAGVAFDRLLDPASGVRWRAVAAAVAVGAVLFGVANAARFHQSRGPFPFRVMPPEVERTLAAVREHCPPEQRVLVPGFSLHWFGGGHVAALPFLTGRAFVANDFYHRRDYRDVVPRDYRDPERFPEFLELFDVGCVLTWDEPWGRRLAELRRATPLHEDGRLRLFRTDVAPNPFLRGRGRVEARLGALTVETDDEDVVLKYRFVDGLRTRPPVVLEPHPVYGELRFVRLRTEGRKRIEIFH